jgi:hypothetical protein
LMSGVNFDVANAKFHAIAQWATCRGALSRDSRLPQDQAAITRT